MESNTGMKGQASVEFLFTILIAIMFIVALVQPSAELASNSTKDVANLSKLKVSAEKLADTIQFVALSGEGTKQTINIVVPAEATINCSGNLLETTYSALSHNQINIPYCVSGSCTNTIDVGAEFDCFEPIPDDAEPNSRLIIVTVDKESGISPSGINVRFI
ncbi:MAG: hypothetical protein ABIH20_03580 [Candidatus Diapherotrites archaeon]